MSGNLRNKRSIFRLCILAWLILGAPVLQAQELGFDLVIEKADSPTNDWQAIELDQQMLTTSGRLWIDQRTASTSGNYRLRIVPNRMVDLNEMIYVTGGILPTNSVFSGQSVDSFHLARYELTWAKWLEVRNWAATNGYDIGSVGSGCQPNHPAQSMSWLDAVKWCNARSEQEGLPPVYFLDGAYTQVLRATAVPPADVEVFANFNVTGFRLPTEAEWEFAARGGNASQNTIYSGSDVLDDVGWYRSNTLDPDCVMQDDRGTFRVGLKLDNELGFRDMSGNVIEWCWDAHLVFDGVWITKRRCRGGSWFALSEVSKISTRLSNVPGHFNHSIGMRVARSD